MKRMDDQANDQSWNNWSNEITIVLDCNAKIFPSLF